MIPKRRFWNGYKRWNADFSRYFSMVRSPNIVLKPFKRTSKTRISSFVTIPKSSFGEHEFRWRNETKHSSWRWLYASVVQFINPCWKKRFRGSDMVRLLWYPNEDFGRMNKRWTPHFRDTFHWLVAKSSLFLIPKSSFGSHDVTTIDHTVEYVRFVNWITQSDVAMVRKCCFPHGLSIDLSHLRTSGCHWLFRPQTTYSRFFKWYWF